MIRHGKFNSIDARIRKFDFHIFTDSQYLIVIQVTPFITNNLTIRMRTRGSIENHGLIDCYGAFRHFTHGGFRLTIGTNAPNRKSLIHGDRVKVKVFIKNKWTVKQITETEPSQTSILRCGKIVPIFCRGRLPIMTFRNITKIRRCFTVFYMILKFSLQNLRFIKIGHSPIIMSGHRQTLTVIHCLTKISDTQKIFFAILPH
ncbi:hypothetical protein Y5W_02891 [Alcanivorax sp. 521-1]|uniref:Uncharacterized protein n=1 Tax=Alloalcanivorax profundimaris TaxID=2735259 RepID=A0ABS0ATY7_9GAMM|nr:hypothetical protein [Alloalcanivorax profundimaris]